MIGSCIAHGIEFTYALSPGLDICYSSSIETEAIERRFQQLIDIGAKSFALLFDDIPDRMRPEDARAFGSFAEAQAHVANHIAFWLSDRLAEHKLFFCPTP